MKRLDRRILHRYTILFAVIWLWFVGCAPKKKSELVWDKNFPGIGSQSSPRTTDLNGDGILDVVIGAGQNEYQQSDQGILALDGRTGHLLWEAASEDQVYGCATLLDITGDHVDDVFIGGRSPYFKALNGRNGKTIWEYKYHHENDPILRHAKFNFNNSVLLPDQNGDGVSDLLTVNGGNSKAAPYATEDRFPGVMILFDSKSGEVLAADTMPDGRESYMSPVWFSPGDDGEPVIIFGTGGETISGNLYAVRLSDLMARKLSAARVIAAEKGHGFIAPPTLADITRDGVPDVIAISHGSTVFAIDGKNDQLLWKRNIPETESSNSLAAGFFTDDDIPDLFTFVSKGQWPNSTGSLQVMLDGRDGTIAYIDSIGCTGFSSPVVYDINRDGRDEAIISINEYDCSLGFAGRFPTVMENKLIAIDFGKHTVQTIDQQTRFKNIFTTPWIGDMDDDGYLDIVHCQYFHYGDLLSFRGMRMKRIATPIKMKDDPAWGAYMGSEGNGIFRKGE